MNYSHDLKIKITEILLNVQMRITQAKMLRKTVFCFLLFKVESQSDIRY